MIRFAGVTLRLPELRNEREREFIVSSSSLRIERRAVPRPHQQIVPPHPEVPGQQRPVRNRDAAAKPARAPRELARRVAHSPPQPARSTRRTLSLQAQLDRQEREFERQAEAMHESRAPLAIATTEPQPPSSIRRSLMDIEGRLARTSVQAVLIPLPGRHWIANGMSCYYVHYYASYSTGGSEEGNIPWPVCYPAAHDAMLPLDKAHSLPIPEPPPGYVLPPGTPIGPLLSAIYHHQLPGE